MMMFDLLTPPPVERSRVPAYLLPRPAQRIPMDLLSGAIVTILLLAIVELVA